MCRRILLVLALLALAAVAPALAAPAAVPNPQGGCPPSLDFLAPAAPASASCKAESPATVAAQPEFMAVSTVYTGFCRCSCSRVRNCNTSADCGGSACLGGITCC